MVFELESIMKVVDNGLTWMDFIDHAKIEAKSKMLLFQGNSIVGDKSNLLLKSPYYDVANTNLIYKKYVDYAWLLGEKYYWYLLADKFYFKSFPDIKNSEHLAFKYCQFAFMDNDKISLYAMLRLA